MAWFSRARCPIDDAMRKWVEYRMSWLATQFGWPAWLNAPAVVPTDAFFPDRFDGSEYAVERMLHRVCGYMGVDPTTVALRLYHEDRDQQLGRSVVVHTEGGGTAGLYTREDRHIVMIEAGNLSDPVAIVATIAHELCHVRLLGENRVTGNEDDHEQLTDLATVFFGLGVFNANAVVRFSQWQQDGVSGWSTAKKGYLNEATFAYALALWAYVRREGASFPHLCPSVRRLARQGVRFLDRASPGWLHERRRPLKS